MPSEPTAVERLRECVRARMPELMPQDNAALVDALIAAVREEERQRVQDGATQSQPTTKPANWRFGCTAAKDLCIESPGGTIWVIPASEARTLAITALVVAQCGFTSAEVSMLRSVGCCQAHLMACQALADHIELLLFRNAGK